jgi:hypothetical protein
MFASDGLMLHAFYAPQFWLDLTVSQDPSMKLLHTSFNNHQSMDIEYSKTLGSNKVLERSQIDNVAPTWRCDLHGRMVGLKRTFWRCTDRFWQYTECCTTTTWTLCTH